MYLRAKLPAPVVEPLFIMISVRTFLPLIALWGFSDSISTVYIDVDCPPFDEMT